MNYTSFQYPTIPIEPSDLTRGFKAAVLAGLDNGHCSVRLFFADFKTGFDLVDHNAIVQELLNFDVHPILIQWIKVFLTDREQCVKIDPYQSSWRKTIWRSPAGDKTWPITFFDPG